MRSILLIGLYFVFEIQTGDGAVQLSANPGVIDPGVTSLTVRCDVNQSSQSNMSAILSIIVSRAANGSSTYTDLASVVTFLGQKVNVLSSEGLTANGSVQDAGHSFLELHWNQPTEAQAGHYLCTVQGPDAVGHNIDWIAETDVTATHPGNNQLLDKILQLDLDLKLANEKLANLTRDFTSITQDLLHYNTAREKDMQQFLFSPGFLHNNSTIAVSRNRNSNIGAAENLCQIYGGYLVEIDDAAEYTALVAYLNNISDIKSVYIGIYRDVQTGEYKFRRSGKTAPVLVWADNMQRDYVDDDICVLMLKIHQWKMLVSLCGDNNLAVCEFPRDV
ncbi:uncharacterized protein LOC131932793 [Physella acuta]|uniref:uncharacterized protein LOC131932793 n=1 Tax=Physella acuta TaxID=109671 RepID=UPI0027DC308D|nr:uncharacterized protein LOC131932793 [Physella acuta]